MTTTEWTTVANFDNAKGFCENLYQRRGKQASPTERSAWLRIERLNASCPGKLKFRIHIPALSRQDPIEQVKSYVVQVNEGKTPPFDVFRTKSGTTPETANLTPAQIWNIATWRTDALVVYTTESCRVPGGDATAMFGAANLPTGFGATSPIAEILYIQEMATGDAASTIAAVANELKTSTIFAEVASVWAPYFTNKGFKQLTLQTAPRPDQTNLSYFLHDATATMDATPVNGPNNVQGILYPADDEKGLGDPRPERPKTRALVVDGPYEGKTDEEKLPQFMSDYTTLMNLPSDLSPTEIEAVKDMQRNMYEFTVNGAKQDPERYRLLGKVEAVLLPQSLRSEVAGEDWYMRSLKDKDTSRLAEMRAYADGANRYSSQIDFERQNMGLMTSEAKSQSAMYGVKYASSPADLKGLVLMDNGSLEALCQRMNYLRTTQWPKMAQDLQLQETKALKENAKDPTNAATKQMLADILSKKAALAKARAEMETAYQQVLKSSEQQNLNRTTLVACFKASQDAVNALAADAALFPAGSSSPAVGVAQPPGVLQFLLDQQAALAGAQLPTTNASDTRELVDKLKGAVEEFKKTETSKVGEIKAKAEDQYAIASKAYEQIKKLVTDLRAQGPAVTNQLNDFDDTVKSAIKCYRGAIDVATKMEQKDVTASEMQIILDTLLDNNRCLGSYIGVFKSFETQAQNLYKSNEQKIVQEWLAKMQITLRKAQTAIAEAKMANAQTKTDKFKPFVESMEGTLREMQTIYDTAVKGRDALTPAQAQAYATDLETKAGAIISYRLRLTPENEDSINTALLLMQLEGSELNLQQAQREAKESAVLAQERLKALALAQDAQRALLDKANSIVNPMRIVTATSQDSLTQQSQNALQRRRLMLKSMLVDLRAAIRSKKRNDVPSLISKVQDFQASLAQTKELADLLAESEELRTEARKMLADNDTEPIPRERTDLMDVEEYDIEDQKMDLVSDILDDLQDALDEDSVDDVQDLLAELEEATEDLDLAIVQKQDGELYDRLLKMRANAQSMVAKSMSGGRKQGARHHNHKKHHTSRHHHKR